MGERRWVIMNTQEKMTLSEAAKWYATDLMTVMHVRRLSNRGSNEEIYVIGYGKNCYGHKGNRVPYVTDTGNGYGGVGEIHILNAIEITGDSTIMSFEDVMAVNEKIKLPIWVFK